MKALVIGCGSIGLRHIGHLRQLGVSDIVASDLDPAARRKAQEQFGVSVSYNADQALQRSPEIALVCTPAVSHVQMTLKALDAGAHVFVEKPLSTNLKDLDVLVKKAAASGRIVQVGYNLRYHPAFKAIKNFLDCGRLGRVLSAHVEFGLYLPMWWTHRDYRQSYMADAELSGGLLFDVSHEIDSLIWFLGNVQQVTAYAGKLSGLEISGSDLIKVLLQMESGAIVSLHIDCLQPTYTRVYSLIGEGTGLRWDCPEGRVDSNLGRLKWFNPDLGRYERVALEGNPGDTYLEELRDFVQVVETGKSPLVGLKDGIATLRVALAIQEAIQTGRAIPVKRCSPL